LQEFFPDLHSVHLTRADTARQAISYWRANQTQQWWDLGEQDGPPAELDPDFQQIRWCEDILVDDDRGWQGILERQEIPTLKINYESFIEVREQTVEEVLDFLEIPHGPITLPPPQLRRQSDELTEEWLTAYRIVRDGLPGLPEHWQWERRSIVPVEEAPTGRREAGPASPVEDRIGRRGRAAKWTAVGSGTSRRRVGSMEAARPLAEIVANRRWQRRLKPFPYVVVPDLFIPSVAEEISAAVRKVLDGERLGNIARYDASGWGFPADLDWPLRVFVTKEWRDLIARALGVETIPFVSGSIHHHDPGGESGRPHNDLNPVYFADSEPRDGMVVLRGDLVDLKSGQALQEGTRVIRTIRAVSILYYTANPPWSRGDGGETGLYERRSDRVNRPAVAVAPANNTLLAFECTPNSFHSFISNRVTERNSITMWLHQSDKVAVRRWGEQALERWKESPPPPGDTVDTHDMDEADDADDADNP
jgi:hypothetical protein